MILEIRRITQLNDELVAALADLIPQLSSVLSVPDSEQLQRVVDGPHSALFVAFGDGRAIGMLSMGWYDVPSGRCGWIEDVVVDGFARGCGVGEKLVNEAVKVAEQQSIRKITLTSNKSREAAHALYKKLGFEQVETSVFCLKFKKL